MLKINKEIIRRLQATSDIKDVQNMLAGAVSLEYSTIPPYLTALFSIKDGNHQARALVHSIVIEEMLHMTLAANTLIAIGGNPHIREEALKVKYPGPLPMCIDEDLTVTLGSLTKQQVGEVFMAIERPDTTAILPGEMALRADAQPSYASIGQFYQAVLDKLGDLVAQGQNIFREPRLDQQLDVSVWFPPEIKSFPDGKVHSMESATAVINTIVWQGEGVQIRKDRIDPMEGHDGNYAHYFKFGEIFYGHKLVPDRDAPSGWSYTGHPVPLDEDNIINVKRNAALSDYPIGSGAHIAGKQFYDAYHSLLVALDETFNGHPERMNSALGIMFEMKLVAQQVMQFRVENEPVPVYAAPPFMRTHEPR